MTSSSEERTTEPTRDKANQLQAPVDLGPLASWITHEFNNVLTGIIGNVELARLDLPEGSPASECLEEIQEAVERAVELCHQLQTCSGNGAAMAAVASRSKLFPCPSSPVASGLSSVGRNAAGS